MVKMRSKYIRQLRNVQGKIYEVLVNLSNPYMEEGRLPSKGYLSTHLRIKDAERTLCGLIIKDHPLVPSNRKNVTWQDATCSTCQRDHDYLEE